MINVTVENKDNFRKTLDEAEEGMRDLIKKCNSEGNDLWANVYGSSLREMDEIRKIAEEKGLDVVDVYLQKTLERALDELELINLSEEEFVKNVMDGFKENIDIFDEAQKQMRDFWDEDDEETKFYLFDENQKVARLAIDIIRQLKYSVK